MYTRKRKTDLLAHRKEKCPVEQEANMLDKILAQLAKHSNHPQHKEISRRISGEQSLLVFRTIYALLVCLYKAHHSLTNFVVMRNSQSLAGLYHRHDHVQHLQAPGQPTHRRIISKRFTPSSIELCGRYHVAAA